MRRFLDLLVLMIIYAWGLIVGIYSPAWWILFPVSFVLSIICFAMIDAYADDRARRKGLKIGSAQMKYNDYKVRDF